MQKDKRAHGSTLKSEAIGKENERLVLETLIRPLTMKQISSKCGLSHASVWRRLDSLMAVGVVQRLPGMPARFEAKEFEAKADAFAALEKVVRGWRVCHEDTELLEPHMSEVE